MLPRAPINQTFCRIEVKMSIKNPAMTKDKVLVGTDLDETMTSFLWYFAPAMRLIIPKLAKKFSKKFGRKVTNDEVSWELGRIMDSRSTHEWPWVWEESKFWQDPELRKMWRDYKQFRRVVVKPYHEALDAARRKYCKTYPNVAETLASLRKHGKKVAVVSNGPDFSVFTKVAQNKLDEFVDLVIAIDIPEPPASSKLTDEELAFGRARVQAGRSTQMKCPVKSIPMEWMKPDPRGLQLAMKVLAATPDTTLYIGDSLPGDGGAAQTCGVAFLWAFYGTVHAPADLHTFEHHFVEPSRRKKKTISYPPMLTQYGAATWAEVLQHLTTEPLPLKPTFLNPSVSPKPTDGPNH